MPRTRAPRLGRPPASSAAETRERILTVACDLFATRGYGVTTNKDVADAAGITTGALYYYFDSKLAMYVAVYEDHQQQISERFEQAMGDARTFEARFRAILETAYAMNVENPSIAAFQGAARIDRLRHPELREAIPNPPGEGATLVPALISVGIDSGEIRPESAPSVAALLRTIFVGLVDAVSSNAADQRRAIDAIFALLDGSLLRRPKQRLRSR